MKLSRIIKLTYKNSVFWIKRNIKYLLFISLISSFVSLFLFRFLIDVITQRSIKAIISLFTFIIIFLIVKTYFEALTIHKILSKKKFKTSEYIKYILTIFLIFFITASYSFVSFKLITLFNSLLLRILFSILLSLILIYIHLHLIFSRIIVIKTKRVIESILKSIKIVKMKVKETLIMMFLLYLTSFALLLILEFCFKLISLFLTLLLSETIITYINILFTQFSFLFTNYITLILFTHLYKIISSNKK